MKKLLISTAALILLAAPAWAQRDNGPRPAGPPGAQQHGNHGAPAPHTPGAPAPPRPAPSPTENPFDNSHRAAPAAAPAQNRLGNGHRGGPATRPAPGAAPAQNRMGNGHRGVPGANRPGYSGPAHNGNGRHDFSGFRGYHQSFNATRRYHAGAYRRPSGWYARRWTFGDVLPSLFWASSYWINDYDDYGLPTPPYGAVWVREGDDALLIDRDSGEVISVEYGVFY